MSGKKKHNKKSKKPLGSKPAPPFREGIRHSDEIERMLDSINRDVEERQADRESLFGTDVDLEVR